MHPPFPMCIFSPSRERERERERDREPPMAGGDEIYPVDRYFTRVPCDNNSPGYRNNYT